jgi:ribosome-associated heat shock protein Hsp15
MRADLLLKSLCLVKTRSQARKGCEEGYVRVGGRSIKPGKEIRVGDVVEVRYPDRALVIEILEVPRGQIPRKERDRFFRVVRETKIDDRRGIWNE